MVSDWQMPAAVGQSNVEPPARTTQDFSTPNALRRMARRSVSIDTMRCYLLSRRELRCDALRSRPSAWWSWPCEPAYPGRVNESLTISDRGSWAPGIRVPTFSVEQENEPRSRPRPGPFFHCRNGGNAPGSVSGCGLMAVTLSTFFGPVGARGRCHGPLKSLGFCCGRSAWIIRVVSARSPAARSRRRRTQN